jgi:hypothetical protein
LIYFFYFLKTVFELKVIRISDCTRTDMKTMCNGQRSAVQIPEEFKETVAQECNYKTKTNGCVSALTEGRSICDDKKGVGDLKLPFLGLI